jgi:signal transduction histidine kinase
MIALGSLRARIAASLAAAVLCAMLVYAAVALAILDHHERTEAELYAAGVYTSEEQENLVLFGKLAACLALAAPLAAGAAGAIGLWFARKALAPLREAAERAVAARAGTRELLLPVRGGDDEWDRLAVVLNDLLREERRSIARARSFSANAAHELRTPLTAILGEVQVALRRERGPEEYRAALRSVEEDVSRLTALVERLLTLSRADSGELRPAAVTFDLAAVASEAAAAARARIPDARSAIRLEVSPVEARGDPILSRRVLENLIENAVRHGGPHVEVRVAREGGFGVASVADDGPGLAPEVRARLFERFNRAAGTSGSAEGFGLGLAIAHALTAAQGGRLRLAEDAPATRFVLEVPADDAGRAA